MRDIAYVLEWGAISLPLGHPSRVTCMGGARHLRGRGGGAAEACEFDARVFPITIPDPLDPESRSVRERPTCGKPSGACAMMPDGHGNPATGTCPECGVDCDSTAASGVPVAPETLDNNSPCQPDGPMFDAFCNPRVRYVRVSFDGSHLILSPVEAEQWKLEAEASAASIGQTDPHSYSDVYLSEVEADALPEFDGF